MRRLLRREGFNPGRHNKVSSEQDDFGDRRRVVKDGDPWCTSSGNRFGDWVQVRGGLDLLALLAFIPSAISLSFYPK